MMTKVFYSPMGTSESIVGIINHCHSHILIFDTVEIKPLYLIYFHHVSQDDLCEDNIGAVSLYVLG